MAFIVEWYQICLGRRIPLPFWWSKCLAGIKILYILLQRNKQFITFNLYTMVMNVLLFGNKLWHHDAVIAWKYFLHYWLIVRVFLTGGFCSQMVRNVGLWYFNYCMPMQVVEQKVELLLIWDVMACHYNDIVVTKSAVNEMYLDVMVMNTLMLGTNCGT